MKWLSSVIWAVLLMLPWPAKSEFQLVDLTILEWTELCVPTP